MTEEPSAIPKTPSSTSTPTPSLNPAINIPRGTSPTIDGIIHEEEWEEALIIPFQEVGMIHLLQDSNYFYVGIEASPEGINSICTYQGDKISILHSSAAVGMAAYTASEKSWKNDLVFSWCCRGTIDNIEDQKEREEYLFQNGWVASNARMGNPQEVEYQLSMNEDSLRLAIVHLQSPDFDTLTWWPEGLNDGCRELQLITGPLPEELLFNTDTWVEITAGGEIITKNSP